MRDPHPDCSMRRLSAAGFALALMSTPPLAFADENDATTCLSTKVQSDYADGWALRTSQTFTLGPGDHRVFKVRMLQGNHYRLQACADDAAQDVDVIVYGTDGQELMRDRTDDGAPTVDYQPERTDTYLVVVHAAQLAPGAGGSGVSFGISYR